MHRLPVLLQDPSYRRLHDHGAAQLALVCAAERGPAQLMDFLVLAGSGGSGEGGSSATLCAVQELGDAAATEVGRGPMCLPELLQPSRQAGDVWLLGAVREDRTGWFTLYVRAHADSADLLVPVAALLALHAASALLSWWVAVFCVPGVVLGAGALNFACERQRSPFASAPRRLPRHNVVGVAALLLAGAVLFVGVLAPALRHRHPGACALEALAFAVNGWSFYRVIFTEAGYVPLGPSAAAGSFENDRLCRTCACLRPLRSKHDPFTGRCVRKFDHYCPLVHNAVGEGNQAYFVLFCLSMLLGQLTFLRLCALFLAQEGEGLLLVLTTRFGRGWVAHPVVMLNLLLQACCTAFNLLLCVRACYGVAAELTSNEMANAARYRYLWEESSGEYHNPFDRGLLRNARRFFGVLWGEGATDWEAERQAQARAPALSAASAFKLARGLAARMGWARGSGRRGAAHGHSHGGVPCQGHGHAHGQAEVGGLGQDKDEVAAPASDAEEGRLLDEQ
jgi:hypothetical protein